MGAPLGHTRAAADGQPRRNIEGAAEEHREHDREEHAIPMNDGKIDHAVRFLVLQEAQVMHDVLVGT